MLSVDFEFNQSVDNLPNQLIKLIIKSSIETYCKFNQSINNLPDSVKQIFLLNERYNCQINKLPKSLEKINLLTKFAYSINHKTTNTNKFDINKLIKKQILNAEIIIDSHSNFS